jgi:hypothetical protein
MNASNKLIYKKLKNLKERRHLMTQIEYDAELAKIKPLLKQPLEDDLFKNFKQESILDKFIGLINPKPKQT